MSGDSNQQIPPEASNASTRVIAELHQTLLMTPPASPEGIGAFGRFEALRLIGEGGMGYVFLAREPVTGVHVAIKTLKPEFAQSPAVRRRFLGEARHMYQMAHPHILRVLEVSQDERQPFYVMPFITDGSLAERLQSAGKGLSFTETLALATQIAEGLRYAHSKGIIHRDLKPANILVTAGDQVFITDFGLSRTVFNDDELNLDKLCIEGTPAYMSPGVAHGVAEDTRCDIYSFGAILYEVLTGVPPYQGASSKQIIEKVLAGPPVPARRRNPGANRRLVNVAESAMERELRNRYAEMSDVIEDLERISRDKEPLGGAGRRSRRQRLGLAVGAVVLLLIPAVSAIAWAMLAKAPPPSLQDPIDAAEPAEDRMDALPRTGVTIAPAIGPRYPELAKAVQDTLRSSYLQRMHYTELATLKEQARGGEWYVGSGLTHDGRAYHFRLVTGSLFYRPLTAEQESAAGLSQNAVRRSMSGIWELPAHRLVELSIPRVQVVPDSDGTLHLRGTLRCTSDRDVALEHAALVFNHVKAEEDTTGRSYQHLPLISLEGGEHQITIDLAVSRSVDLQYGGSFELQAYLRHPDHRFYRISNSLVWQGTETPSEHRAEP